MSGGPGPDPLRSASGSSGGLPSQSQTSSAIPHTGTGTGTGYDIYGRPIPGGSTLGPSGYNTQGIIITYRMLANNERQKITKL